MLGEEGEGGERTEGGERGSLVLSSSLCELLKRRDR